uniref:RING-type domain-containing protein n=1 Tax=Macrostomum lignano TaxID=282301 RepID=A0A1I8FPW4_9PLAT
CRLLTLQAVLGYFPPPTAGCPLCHWPNCEFTHLLLLSNVVGNCVPLCGRGSRRRRPIALANRNSGHVLSLESGREGQPLRAKRMSAGVRLCGLSPGQAVVRLSSAHRDQNQQRPQHQAELSIRVVAPCQCRASAPSRSAWRLAAATICQPIAKAGDLRYSLIETAQPVSHYQQAASATATGSSLLTVSAESRWANQTLTMRVGHLPIAYLMLQYDGPELPGDAGRFASTCPLRRLYGLRVAAFTALGDPIHAANPPLTAHAKPAGLCANCPDFANQSFSLRAIAKVARLFKYRRHRPAAFRRHSDLQRRGAAVGRSTNAQSWPFTARHWPGPVARLLAPGSSPSSSPGRPILRPQPTSSVSEPTDFVRPRRRRASLAASDERPRSAGFFITDRTWLAPVASLAARALFAAGNCTGLAASGGSSTPKLSQMEWKLAVQSAAVAKPSFSDEVSSHRAASGLPVLHAEPTLRSAGGRLACPGPRISRRSRRRRALVWDADFRRLRQRRPSASASACCCDGSDAAPPPPEPEPPRAMKDGVPNLRLLRLPNTGLLCSAGLSGKPLGRDLQAPLSASLRVSPKPHAADLTVSLRLTPTALDGYRRLSQDRSDCSFVSLPSVADLSRYAYGTSELGTESGPASSAAIPSCALRGGSRSTARSDSATDAIGLSDGQQSGPACTSGLARLIRPAVLSRFTARLLQRRRGCLMADPAAGWRFGSDAAAPVLAGAAAGADRWGLGLVWVCSI